MRNGELSPRAQLIRQCQTELIQDKMMCLVFFSCNSLLIIFLNIYISFVYLFYSQLPEPFSFIFTWFAAVPLLLWLAQSITKAIVKDFLILKVGPYYLCFKGSKPDNIAIVGVQTNKCL